MYVIGETKDQSDYISAPKDNCVNVTPKWLQHESSMPSEFDQNDDVVLQMYDSIQAVPLAQTRYVAPSI